MLKPIVLLLAVVTCAAAKVIQLDWTVGWVTAAPDGFARPVIGINGKWPCPTVEGTVGDTLQVKVTNQLGNETTSIHWHGMTQKGTPQMDGTSQVSQCPIALGSSFTYTFKVSCYLRYETGVILKLPLKLENPGTYWYHSHNM